eukprot:5417413-Alexandrium_andersonii.AAC.1
MVVYVARKARGGLDAAATTILQRAVRGWIVRPSAHRIAVQANHRRLGLFVPRYVADRGEIPRALALRAMPM